jgi:CheY-like chemotaxis protein
VTLLEPEAVSPIEVLLVEDDPGDVLMTREAFAEHGPRNRLNVVSDGEQALAYLRQEGPHRDAPRHEFFVSVVKLPPR